MRVLSYIRIALSFGCTDIAGIRCAGMQASDAGKGVLFFYEERMDLMEQ